MSTQAIALPRVSIHRRGVLAIVTVLIAIAAFSGALAELVHRWWSEEEYSHGFLIPLISIWLLWMRRDVVAASFGRPSWLGFALIVVAAAIHIVGEYSSLFILSQLGFIFVLIGVALATGGYPLLKVTFIAIAFLIFAIPVPYFIESKLTLQLQLISSQLGVYFINLAGVPVYLEGNVIDLGYYKLQVVEACSGLRYLYPLLSLSFLAAYLFQAPLWQRILVFLSGIPITIGMNGLRIGLVGLTVDRWGTQMAEGVLHFFEGWVIFIACAALLLAAIFILAKLSGRQFFQVFHLPATAAKLKPDAASPAKGSSVIVGSLLAVCALGMAVQGISHRTEMVPERMRFAAFPAALGTWKGRAGELDPDVRRGLGFDDYILADYNQPNGRPVNFYVAYYSSQRNGYAPHSPSVCIPGGGWLITDLRETEYEDAGKRFPFNRAIIEKGSNKQLVYYWFDERGRRIANEYWAKWYLLSDAIFKNRTDGSLIRLVTQIYPGETSADADQRLRSFMRVLLPGLGSYLPAESGNRRSTASQAGASKG